MKKQISIILLFISSMLFAQYPDASYETKQIENEAKKLTEIYDAKLGLDGTQLPIFQDKIEDYLVLSNKAKERLQGKEQLDKLTQLMLKESLEMKDLLTRIQYQVYKEIRQDIQPLKILYTENK